MQNEIANLAAFVLCGIHSTQCKYVEPFPLTFFLPEGELFPEQPQHRLRSYPNLKEEHSVDWDVP